MLHSININIDSILNKTNVRYEKLLFLKKHLSLRLPHVEVNKTQNVTISAMDAIMLRAHHYKQASGW